MSCTEISRNRQLNAWRMEIATCTGILSRKKLKWITAPENCKNQDINRIKLTKINRFVKLCTLATNNLILS